MATKGREFWDRIRENDIEGLDVRSSRWVLAGSIAVFLAVLIGLPLGFYLWGSVWSTSPGLGDGYFTLDGYQALFDSSNIQVFINTFVIAIFGTILSVGIAIAGLVLSIKSDLPGREAIPFLYISQYMLPGFVTALAWSYFAGADGVMNQILIWVIPFVNEPLFDIHSAWGMALVAGVHYAGLIYLLASGAVQSVPASLEEAATINGASKWKVIRRITLRLSAPALMIAVLLVFIRLLQDFAIMAVLGLRQEIFVIATKMYFLIGLAFPPDFAEAAAMGVVILVMAVIGLFVQQRLSGNREKYATIGGDEEINTPRYSLGKWRKPLAAVLGVVFFLLFVFPFIVIFVSSFQQTFLGFNFEYVQWSFDNYYALFFGSRSGQFISAVINTLVIAGVGAAGGMFLSSIASYFIVRSESPLGELLNILTLSPSALPGIVVSTAFLWLWLTYNFLGLYGTIWIIMLALTARFIVYGSRAMNSAYRSIDDRLEEAAQISGASLYSIAREIFVPLVKPGFLAGYTILFIDYAKVLTIPLFLSTPENQVLSVMLWQVAYDGNDAMSAAIACIMIGAILTVYGGMHFFTDVDITRL